MTAPLFDTGVRWRISSAWARQAHECTLAGILARCGGACCKGDTYWPSRAYGTVCGNLGPAGCVLPDADKPVTCLLYPLRLNHSGALVLHHRATFGKGICKGNHGQGPPLIDALEGQLTELFGADQYAHVRADVLGGRDSWFEVPAAVLAAYEDEERRAKVDAPVVPRRQLPVAGK